MLLKTDFALIASFMDDLKEFRLVSKLFCQYASPYVRFLFFRDLYKIKNNHWIWKDNRIIIFDRTRIHEYLCLKGEIIDEEIAMVKEMQHINSYCLDSQFHEYYQSYLIELSPTPLIHYLADHQCFQAIEELHALDYQGDDFYEYKCAAKFGVIEFIQKIKPSKQLLSELCVEAIGGEQMEIVKLFLDINVNENNLIGIKNMVIAIGSQSAEIVRFILDLNRKHKCHLNVVKIARAIGMSDGVPVFEMFIKESVIERRHLKSVYDQAFKAGHKLLLDHLSLHYGFNHVLVPVAPIKKRQYHKEFFDNFFHAFGAGNLSAVKLFPFETAFLCCFTVKNTEIIKYYSTVYYNEKQRSMMLTEAAGKVNYIMTQYFFMKRYSKIINLDMIYYFFQCGMTVKHVKKHKLLEKFIFDDDVIPFLFVNGLKNKDISNSFVMKVIEDKNNKVLSYLISKGVAINRLKRRIRDSFKGRCFCHYDYELIETMRLVRLAIPKCFPGVVFEYLKEDDKFLKLLNYAGLTMQLLFLLLNCDSV